MGRGGGGVGRDDVEAEDEACDAELANPGESERDAAGETARRLNAWCAYGSKRSSFTASRRVSVPAGGTRE